ncbi:response regulator [Thermoflexus sp.]|uniref:response regulator n=1 Tax=Thermoflexus sp. TaxID=1969742 RepID=UPI0035E40601
MKERPIRLLIVDDHTIVRQGLIALLEDEADLRVVGQAGSAQEALALMEACRPDVVLLDITLPDLSGLEVTRRIVQTWPGTRVLILTMHEEEAFFFEALRAGAAGYVLKGADSEELLYAIHAVYEGGVYLPPKLAASLVRDYLNQQFRPFLEEIPLTPREQTILRLIAQGLTNRQIAERLSLSLNTVKTHRQHLYEKLGLHRRSDLVAYALRRGLISPD